MKLRQKKLFQITENILWPFHQGQGCPQLLQTLHEELRVGVERVALLVLEGQERRVEPAENATLGGSDAAEEVHAGPIYIPSKASVPGAATAPRAERADADAEDEPKCEAT